VPPPLELEELELLLDPPELELLELELLDPPLELELEEELPDPRASTLASFAAPLEEEEDADTELSTFASAPASLPGAGAPELDEPEELDALDPLLLLEELDGPPLFPGFPPVLLLLVPPPSVAASSADEQATATAAVPKPRMATCSTRRIIQELPVVAGGSEHSLGRAADRLTKSRLFAGITSMSRKTGLRHL
jgi:hypothetical protein